MLRRLLLLCLLLVFWSALVDGAGAAQRQDALLTFEPPFERVGGDSTYARIKVMYDGSSAAQGLRGYHAVIDFDDAYIHVNDVELDVFEGDLLQMVGPTAFFSTLEDGNTLVVDGSILGATAGATGPGELFEVRFSGWPAGDGTSLVDFVDVVLRDPDNSPISFTATGGSIELDNTPPDVPVMASLPMYSPGTERTVYWSDESASGAVGYCAQAADNPEFDPIHMTSGCTEFLEAIFFNLDDGQIYYYHVKTRDDLWNTSAWSTSVHSTQDDTPPNSSAGPIAPYYDTMTFWIPVMADDATSGVSAVRLMYQVDGGGYQQFDGTFPPGPVYFQADSEGVYDFYTIAMDAVGNIEEPPLVPDCSTIVDWTAPPSVVDFEALPGHNKIHLSWTVPEERGSPIEGTLIVRKAWGAGVYPEYDDVSPPAGYPGDPEGGTIVAFVPGTGAQTYDDVSFSDGTRNVYYYTAFARDGAGNYSPAASTAQDRSTSYWLADVDEATGSPGVYDGYVDFYDKIVLSDSYYTQYGDTYYAPEMDVGPTDDNSRFGIPLTDDWIDFEDLMIVAMNYGRVDPSSKGGGVDPPGPAYGHLEVSLGTDCDAPQTGEPIEVRIDVDASGEPPRGISCLLEYDPRALEFVSASAESAVTAEEGEFFFYASAVSPGLALVDVAVLGPGRAVAAAGPVATVRFRALNSEPTCVAFSKLVARSETNADVECVSEDLEIGAYAAGVHALRLLQNIPNPFNPSTRISFSLPERARARVAVYSVAGREVAELLDEDLGAGKHSLLWSGRTAAGASAPSGVYFCVLETGGRRLTRKMVLAK